jgi:hypothetical protein
VVPTGDEEYCYYLCDYRGHSLPEAGDVADVPASTVVTNLVVHYLLRGKELVAKGRLGEADSPILPLRIEMFP